MTGKQRQMAKRWRALDAELHEYANYVALGRTVERMEEALLVLKTLRILNQDLDLIDPQMETA